MLLKLADEILINIFSYLSPSDLLRSCRQVSFPPFALVLSLDALQVCQRLSRVSRERSILWIIAENCDYVLPTLEETMSTSKLEQTLLHAELVKDAWTGRRPAIPNILREYSFSRQADFWAVMGDYYVVQPNQLSPQWMWYSLYADTQPAFIYTPTQNPASQRIHSWSVSAKGETNEIYILYTQSDLLGVGQMRNYL